MSPRAATVLAWSLAAASLVLLLPAATLLYLSRSAAPASEDGSNLLDYALTIAFPVMVAAYATVGALVASRRPRNAVGWLLCTVGLATAVEAFTDTYRHYAEAMDLAGAKAADFLYGINPGVLLAIFVLLVFPDGRLPSRRWRPLIWLVVAALAVYVVDAALEPGGPDPLGVELPGSVYGVLVDLVIVSLIVGILGAAASVALRLWRARGQQRQQLKWLVYATSVVVIGGLDAVLFPLPLGDVFWLVMLIGFAGMPVAMGIAILRYRLYDIDVIINRTLVYGALSVIVVGLYILIVASLGTLLQAQGSLFASLLATGLVAVLFAPLRDRLQRAVNRLMYGHRDDPYKVLSGLGERLEATLAPNAVLPTIVESVAQALKLPYAAIALKSSAEGESVKVAEYGKKSAGEPLVVPLSYQQETVGELILSPRSPGESFSNSDLRLLGDLAHQAGVAAHAVHLTTELQRSRERLVTAREEERKRLRRDLHDGVGPQLAALTLKLETARNLLSHDPKTAALMAELSERARATISDVRRSVHALRPPALDELGLVPALREGAAQYSQNGLNISMEAPTSLPPLPAAVEVATYHIAQEAMTNVIRHAGASKCSIRIALDEEANVLHLEVEDDGRGLGEDHKAGVGTHSMRERAEELGGRCTIEAPEGGGTLVSAQLPCWTVRDTHRQEE